MLSLWLRSSPKSEPESASGLKPKPGENKNGRERAELATLLYAFSPLVAFDGEDGLRLDVSGSEKLFDGDINLLRGVSGVVRPFFPDHRISIAPTAGAAWAFSRFGRKNFTIVSKANLRAALGNLPLAALRLEKKTLLVLEELNLRFIEELIRIPRRSLLSRFGPEIIERIDQAFGSLEEPAKNVSFETELRSEKIFSGPVLDQEALRVTAEHLLRRMLVRLAAETKKPSHLLLEVKTIDTAPRLKEIVLSAPTDDEKHLLALLLSRIEKLDMGRGVEWLAIRVRKTARIEAKNAAPALDGKTFFTPGARQTGELFDILGEYLGPENICSLELRESHVPERAFVWGRNPAGEENRASHDFLPRQDFSPTDRPSLLFHIPAPIEVLAALPDHPPVRLKWRSRSYRIVNAGAAERIAPEWWGKDADLGRTREYFKIQLASGVWLWVFREIELQQWFIHGIWC